MHLRALPDEPRPAGFWADLPLARKSLLVLHIPLLALVVGFIVLYVTNRAQTDAADSVEHTRIVRQNLAELFDGVIEAEGAVRGFVISHDAVFLDPYRRQTELLGERFSELESLMRDNPPQIERLAQLRGAVEAKLNRMRTVIDSVAPEGTRAIPDETVRLLTDGRSVMDQVRATVRAIDAEEERLEKIRWTRAERARQVSLALTGLSVILGGGGGIVAILLLSGSLVRRLQIVEQSAGQLARGLPLVPASLGEDEIGQVEHKLEIASELLASRTQALEASNRRLERTLDAERPPSAASA